MSKSPLSSAIEAQLHSDALSSKWSSQLVNAHNNLIEVVQEHKEEVKEYKQTAQEILVEAKRIQSLPKGPKGDSIKGDPGRDADEDAVVERLSALIPTPKEIQRIDEEGIVMRVLAKVPKPDLINVPEIDTKAIAEDVVALIVKEKKLKIEDINGLRGEVDSYRHQMAMRQAGQHGGGDTIVAGTGVTLVRNANGTTTINATGGGASPLTTKGDIYTYSTLDTRLPVGTNGQVLSADSTAATGLKWITASGTGTVTSVASADGSITVTNPTTTADLAVVKAPILTTGRTISTTGDVTYTSGSFNGSANVTGTATIATSAVTLAKMADVATATVFYRKTGGTGAPEVQTLATLKTDLGLTGTNSGDQTITLTSDVTGSGTGSFATTIANNAVTNAKAAQMATLTIKGNNTGGTANALDLTVAQVNLILPVFTSALNGLVPLSGGGTTNFLRADGTWAAAGGGASPLTTKGDLYTFSTVDARLGVGANGTVLMADSTAGTGLKWGSVLGTGDVIGPTGALADSIVSFDGATGKLIKDNLITISGGTIDMQGGDLTNFTNLSSPGSGMVDVTDVLTDQLRLRSNGGSFSTYLSSNLSLAGNTSIVFPLTNGSSGQFLQGDGAGNLTYATAVTRTGGALTSNAVVLGAGTNDTKVVTGITTDGTSALNLGAAGTSVGKVVLANATSGTITMQPVTGALGTVTLSVPAATDTLVGRSTTDTLINKRNQPRTASSTSNATLTPDLSSANVYYRTTQTVGLTIAAPTGTPVIGEVITIYVDSAGAQTLTMNATYIVFGTAFPASTTAGKTLMITAQFNGTDWKTTWVNAV